MAAGAAAAAGQDWLAAASPKQMVLCVQWPPRVFFLSEGVLRGPENLITSLTAHSKLIVFVF
jgi:hypothetical protein